MKHCYKCNSFKLPSEFNKNKSKPDGLATPCRECNKKASLQYTRAKSKENRERASIWYYNNKDKALKRIKETNKKWQKENKHKKAAIETKRRATKLKATPSWLTKEQLSQIEAIYWLARLQYELTDEKYHVDHIVPLKGKTVCGLHVPWNLQVLPAKENISKGNKIVL